MHFKTFVSSVFAIAIVLAHSNSSGQEKFQLPEVNPSTFDRNTPGNQLGFEPIEGQSSGIKEEGNRGNFDQPFARTRLSPRKFDEQPSPPRPKSFDQPFANRPTNKPNSQNPLELLDPNKIAPSPNVNQRSSRALPPITFDQQSSASIRQPLRSDQSVLRNQASMTPNISTASNDSSQLVPATYNSPQIQDRPGNSTPVANAGKSKDTILNRYDVSSNNRPLPGVPVSLKDLMQSTPLKYRMAMVKQYWETYFDWATLQNRFFYVAWLNQIPTPRTNAEKMILQTAKSMAQNDVTAAQIQLSKSQVKLQQISLSKTQGLLPLPLNQPVVTKYNSHYQWYASRNRLPAKLKGINEVFPQTFKLISQRAQTVNQAEIARNQSQQAFAGGQLSLGDLLESGRSWQTSLQSFVGTVVNYNHAIGDYALTITSPQKPIDQIVAMLVAKPKSVNEIATRNAPLQRNTQPLQSAQQNLNPTSFNSSTRNAQNNGLYQSNRGRAANNNRIARNPDFSNPSADLTGETRSLNDLRPNNSVLAPATTQPKQQQAMQGSQDQKNAFNRLNNRSQNNGNGAATGNSFGRGNGFPAGNNNKPQPSSGGGSFGTN